MNEKETKLVRHGDGSATLYTRNVQDGVAHYYAQELYTDELSGQGDVYDITQEEYEAVSAS